MAAVVFTDASVNRLPGASLKVVAAAQTLTAGGWTNDIMSNNEEEPLYKTIHS